MLWFEAGVATAPGPCGGTGGQVENGGLVGEDVRGESVEGVLSCHVAGLIEGQLDDTRGGAEARGVGAFQSEKSVAVVEGHKLHEVHSVAGEIGVLLVRGVGATRLAGVALDTDQGPPALVTVLGQGCLPARVEMPSVRREGEGLDAAAGLCAALRPEPQVFGDGEVRPELFAGGDVEAADGRSGLGADQYRPAALFECHALTVVPLGKLLARGAAQRVRGVGGGVQVEGAAEGERKEQAGGVVGERQSFDTVWSLGDEGERGEPFDGFVVDVLLVQRVGVVQEDRTGRVRVSQMSTATAGRGRGMVSLPPVGGGRCAEAEGEAGRSGGQRPQEGAGKLRRGSSVTRSGAGARGGSTATLRTKSSLPTPLRSSS